MITRVRWIIMALTIIIVLYVFQSYNSLIRNLYPERMLKKIYVPAPVITGSPSLESPLVVVVCNPGENKTFTFGKAKQRLNASALANNSKQEEEIKQLRNSWIRQGQQISTMLKTLLFFSKSPKWRIIFITDTQRTFQRVVNLTNDFPESQRQRLLLENKELSLPKEYPELLYHWRPCAWAKQFLAEMLPDEDAVIYVDSDLLFLGPPEELWWLLTSMGPKQLITVAPEPFYVMEKNPRPYAGRAGLNSGVMAINLTRARDLPGGGVGSAILLDGAIYPPPRHDQDALNNLLKKNPHLLSEVTSRWNFLPSACMDLAPPCPDCHSAGILVLHGADMSFYRSIDAKFNVVYATLTKAPLDMDPEHLLAMLSGQLALTDTIKLPYPCFNFTNINDALTLRLVDEAIDSVQRKGKHRS